MPIVRGRRQRENETDLQVKKKTIYPESNQGLTFGYEHYHLTALK